MEMKSGMVKVSRTRPLKILEWARSGHKPVAIAVSWRRLIFLKRQAKEREDIYRRMI